MPKVTLYAIETAEIKDCWENEEGDFTPWLSDPANLTTLSEQLDLDLELLQSEAPVGPYRADLLCRDRDSGRYIVVENQLTPSDHRHLGQLLTYAAGLDASALVWIAHHFTDEHKATLEWLNRVTNESVGLFAFAIKMIRINDRHGVELEPIVTPNSWTKRVRASAAQVSAESDLARMKIAYWREFQQVVSSKSELICPEPRSHLNINFRFNVPGTRITVIANTRWEAPEDDNSQGIRVQLVFDTKQSGRLYNKLLENRQALEEEFGRPLVWYFEPNIVRRRIMSTKNVDIQNTLDWPNQHAWLVNQLTKFYQIFVPRLKQLAKDTQ